MRAALALLNGLAARLLVPLGRPWLGPFLIVLIALLATLPGQRALPVIDRDEARFVQASRQMLETGDYIDPRNQDAPRYQKPIGIYWLQTAVATLDGRGADAPVHVFRIVSVAGIALAALATWWAFTPLLGAAGAALAGVMVATATVTIGEAHLAKTDAALLAVTTWAQAALIRSWLAARQGTPTRARWLFWVMLALGTLIKGPITPMLAIFTAAGLMLRDRSLALGRALAPARGLALFLALAAPWFIAIGVLSQGRFYALSFGGDLMGKVGQGAEGHTGPTGYYLMTMWLAFWPWAPLALMALPTLWHRRTEPLATIAAAWIVPFWLIFEATSTKLPHYTMPTLPVFAALAVLALTARPPLWLRLPAALLLTVGAAALAALIALGPIYVDARPELLSLILAATGFLLALAAGFAILTTQLHAAAALALAAALVMMPTFSARTLPALPVLFPAERIAALDTRLDACADRPAASLGLTEMSIVVRTGTDAQFPTIQQAATLLRRPGNRVFVTEDGNRLLTGLTDALGTQPREIANFDTINYNRSDRRLKTRLFIHPGDDTLGACLP